MARDRRRQLRPQYRRELGRREHLRCLSGAISGSTFGVTKTGAGTVILSHDSGYTGPTKGSAGALVVSGSISGTTHVAVTTGGTLLLSGAGATNNKLNTTPTATFGGGKLDLGGMTSSLDQQVGALTLSSSSVLDFGTLAAGNTFR